MKPKKIIQAKIHKKSPDRFLTFVGGLLGANWIWSNGESFVFYSFFSPNSSCEHTLFALSRSVGTGILDGSPGFFSAASTLCELVFCTKIKRTAFAVLLILVRVTGLEPARRGRKILNLMRLPIPPHPHKRIVPHLQKKVKCFCIFHPLGFPSSHFFLPFGFICEEMAVFS